MTRGLLEAAVRNAIDAQLPQVMPARDLALSLMPDVLSTQFDSESYVPIACVCFQDCTSTMAEIRVALFEYSAHGTYYRQVQETADEMVAVFFERYFLDDAAFRLYSAGEHLANAVVFMLNLSDADLQPYRTKRISQQSIVAAYLRKHTLASNLAETLLTLGGSEAWQFTMTYRNSVVHDQPPAVSGLGLSYRRRLRWVVSADKTKKRLDIGGSDLPELDIGTIAKHVRAANDLFVTTVNEVLDEYFKILEQHGIRREPDGLTIDRRQ